MFDFEQINQITDLVALATLSIIGAASAQSSVTIYGAVDAALTQYSSEGAKKTGISNSQLGSSKLGFTGVEDLGGGLKANFKLEGGLANDFGGGKASNSSNQAGGSGNGAAGPFTANNGAQGLVFQRYSYVGLSGAFGEVRLGRDYTTTFLQTIAAVDPFSTNGPADSSNMTLNLGVRGTQATTSGASNMIGYMSPSMSGFQAGAQVFFGENRSTNANAHDGDGYSVIALYSNGPIYASVAQQRTKGTIAAAVPATFSASGGITSGTGIPASNGDYTQRGVALSYDFGAAKAVYTYASENLAITAGAADATNRSNLLGVIVPFGAANFKASYVRSRQVTAAGTDTGVLLGLGVDYALSKRTTVYGTYARVTNSNGNAFSAGGAGGASGTTLTAAANPTSTGIAIGMKHNF